jgi:4-hydroxybenzoate polyprenyltransferase
MALHTTGVTALSRGEVHGAQPATAALAAAVTAVSAFSAICSVQTRTVANGSASPSTSPSASANGSASTTGRRALTALLATTYAAAVGTAQARAIRSPDAGTVRTATGAGIRGMMPLQAALLAANGAPRTALGLIAAGPVARAATSVVSPT